ncbi:MAG: hypothetical protein RIT19_2978 [Verrucomicrobiota bacterium]|jgi:hypothetical protein
MRFLPLLLSIMCFSAGVQAKAPARLASSLVFHAPFDHLPDAVVGAGDRRFQTGPKWEAPRITQPGLPTNGAVWVDPRGGRHGGALRFERKIPQVVGFRVEGNFPWRTNQWSATVGFWLRSTPEIDIPKEYSDVIQITSKAWDDAALFVEFTPDDLPKHLRLGAYADKKVWNPQGRDWDKMPLSEKPLVVVTHPPFRREEWHQVVFTCDRFNSGRADGRVALYLDGQPAGELPERQQSYGWKLDDALMMLGLGYTGWMDDLAVFDRALSAEEVKALYRLPGGVSDLHGRRR